MSVNWNRIVARNITRWGRKTAEQRVHADSDVVFTGVSECDEKCYSVS
jgi:hypothetical protein